jgi:hypothetical protein
MTWGAALYFQKLDWGWKEPRKEIAGLERVPSEFDKRVVAVKEAQQAAAPFLPQLKPAQDALAEAGPYLGDNHVWYLQQLARLRNDPGAIQVKDIKFAPDGRPALDTPGKPLGKPILEAPVPDVAKSYAQYAKDLSDIQKKIGEATTEIKDWLAKQQDLTFKLNGKDDTGKVVKIGLYALLEDQAKEQAQTRFEMRYIEPLWLGALENVDLFTERRQQLEVTLDKLKKARAQK